MVVTLGQQYNIGEKPTVILYTYIKFYRHTIQRKQKHCSTSSNMVVITYCYIIGCEDKVTTRYYYSTQLIEVVNTPYPIHVLLRFCLYAFFEAAALRSIVLRYAGAPIATRTRVSFSSFGDVAFSEYFLYHTISAYSLYGEYVIRSFLPNGVFLPCDHGLDF